MNQNKKNLIILVICYIAYTAIYTARLNLSIATPVFIELAIADSAQIGILGSVFSSVYAIGRFINGGLGDRIAPWKLICSGLLLVGIANLLIGTLPPFTGLVVLWGTNAWAQSMLWSSIIYTISVLYDTEKAKKMVTYMSTSVATGNIIGILLNTWLVDQIGVNFAFVIPGGITLVMAAAVLLSIRHIEAATQTKKAHISLFAMLKNRELLFMIAPAMLHGAIRDNVTLWMTAFFVDTFLIDLNDSAYFVLFIPLLGFVTRAVYPTLYKLCKSNEHTVSLFAFIACTVMTLPLCFGLKSPIIAVICLGAIYAMVSIINTSILSIYPIHYTETGNVSSVCGLMDLATYSGAGISSWIYGIVIKNTGYLPMFASWVALGVIGVLIAGWFAMKRREKQRV